MELPVRLTINRVLGNSYGITGLIVGYRGGLAGFEVNCELPNWKLSNEYWLLRSYKYWIDKLWMGYWCWYVVSDERQIDIFWRILNIIVLSFLMCYLPYFLINVIYTGISRGDAEH
jgi:hypothetical protein